MSTATATGIDPRVQRLSLLGFVETHGLVVPVPVNIRTLRRQCALDAQSLGAEVAQQLRALAMAEQEDGS
jgi:hypothetical protein